MSLQLEKRAVLGLTTGTLQPVTHALHCVCCAVYLLPHRRLTGVLEDCCNYSPVLPAGEGFVEFELSQQT